MLVPILLGILLFSQAVKRSSKSAEQLPLSAGQIDHAYADPSGRIIVVFVEHSDAHPTEHNLDYWINNNDLLQVGEGKAINPQTGCYREQDNGQLTVDTYKVSYRVESPYYDAVRKKLATCQ